MSASAVGALVGLIGGLGLAVAVSGLPPLRRPRLIDRLSPYLRDAAAPSRLLSETDVRTPFPTLERIVWPVARRAAIRLERWLGAAGSVRRRLVAAGREPSVEQFRVEQVIWGAAGLLAAVAGSVMLIASGRVASPAALAGFCLVCAIGGAFARDAALSRAVRQREALLLAEFPTIAELLALAVSAGEGPIGSLERVTKSSRGELARELRRVLDDTRAGLPLTDALGRLSERTALPPISRFVDGVIIAIERGTPLADVLRAQAADARATAKRALLESGGRREIAMLLPVVFLIMPVTVVFALFPGFYGFTFTSP
ncbi:MAG TPA: type II secretion system F family protein [Actinomycetes bacterium]|nr:type II secretion system F family protein [Actinomycetes bacterium]